MRYGKKRLFLSEFLHAQESLLVRTSLGYLNFKGMKEDEQIGSLFLKG